MSALINVTQLNNYIHNVFISEELLHNVQVCGEISEFKIVKGHAYFTLKDMNAQISCTCFNVAKTYVPKVGDSVVLLGSVDYYEKGGRLNFVTQTIKLAGNGYLYLMFEQLKSKLNSQGYFDESKKKKIPQYCENVCVITSANGAAIKDIITTVKKRNNYLNIVIRDVRVQGDSCAKEVIEAIKEVDHLNFDAIVIARGGGSFEDLNGFNDEKLVYAIFEAKTPIISAVGHETDFTLCDFVSDFRCPTPTAAGQLIAFDGLKIKEYLNNCNYTLMSKLDLCLTNSRNQLKLLCSNLYNALSQKITYTNNNIITIYQSLKFSYQNLINRKTILLNEIMSNLKAHNLQNLLDKGFWQVYKGTNLLNDAQSLQIGDKLTLKSVSGTINVEVQEVNNNEVR